MSNLVIAPTTIEQGIFPGYVWDDAWTGNPVQGTARISSPFGIYRPSFRTTHLGIDLAIKLASVVYAPAAGKVVWTNLGAHPNEGAYDRDHALGRFVILRHINGWETLYAHLGSIDTRLVIGSEVGRGSPIGTIGMTGNTNGPHLHFMVSRKPSNMWRGSPYLADPAKFIRATSPLLEGSKPPVLGTVQSRLDFHIAALKNAQTLPLRVEHARGYERWVYETTVIKGLVTDDEG